MGFLITHFGPSDNLWLIGYTSLYLKPVVCTLDSLLEGVTLVKFVNHASRSRIISRAFQVALMAIVLKRQVVANLGSVTWHGACLAIWPPRSALVYLAVKDSILACFPVLACATEDA